VRGYLVSSLATGVCNIVTAPGIAVTNSVQFARIASSMSTARRNTGNVTLVSITVTDNVAGNLSASLSSTTLAPGGSAPTAAGYNGHKLDVD